MLNEKEIAVLRKINNIDQMKNEGKLHPDYPNPKILRTKCYRKTM